MERPSCVNCSYWEKPATKKQPSGVCKRIAPGHTLVALDGCILSSDVFTDAKDWCGEHPEFDRWAVHLHTLANIECGATFDEGNYLIVNSVSGSYHTSEGGHVKGPNFIADKAGAEMYTSPVEALKATEEWPAVIDWELEALEENVRELSFTVST